MTKYLWSAEALFIFKLILSCCIPLADIAERHDMGRGQSIKTPGDWA